MKHYTHFSRPAIAAIAAVLALSTAPAMAQPAADEPVVAPSLPPIAAEPAAAPEAAAPAEPATVQIAPPAEVVQSVPATEPEAAAPAAATTRAPAQTRSSPVIAAPAQPSPAKEVLARPAAAPVTAPVSDSAADVAATQAAPMTQPSATNSDVDNAALWALGAGGLLLVGGLGAVAFSRSRRQPVSPRGRRTESVASKTSPVVVPAVAAEAAIAVPEQIVVNPKEKTTHSRVNAATSDWPELEKMVAAKPNAENPFLTRSKRMRRAKFLVEHGEPKRASQPATHAAKEPKQEVKPKPAPKTAAKTANGKSNATYSFGGKATARANWKPATT